jgi:SOS-response transcriptional repressor LexA
MTLEALAAELGCSKAQLSLMENGQRTVSLDWARRMESALDILDGRLVAALNWERTPAAIREEITRSIDATARLRQAVEREGSLDELYRSGRLHSLVNEIRSNVDDPRPLSRQIPVINRVAAGYPREFTDLDYPRAVADEYIAVPDLTDPDAFAARVVGDSMEPDYREGEIVVFSPALDTPSGSDCFVRLERDNETTFKRIYLEDEGRTIRLQPLNSRYPPRTVDREDVAGLYAAAHVIRSVRVAVNDRPS